MKKKFIDPNIKNKSVTVEKRLQFVNEYELPTEPLPQPIPFLVYGKSATTS